MIEAKAKIVSTTRASVLEMLGVAILDNDRSEGGAVVLGVERLQWSAFARAVVASIRSINDHALTEDGCGRRSVDRKVLGYSIALADQILCIAAKGVVYGEAGNMNTA